MAAAMKVFAVDEVLSPSCFKKLLNLEFQVLADIVAIGKSKYLR